MNKKISILILLLLVFLMLVSCGSKPKYINEKLNFSVEYPETWVTKNGKDNVQFSFPIDSKGIHGKEGIDIYDYPTGVEYDLKAIGKNFTASLAPALNDFNLKDASISHTDWNIGNGIYKTYFTRYTFTVGSTKMENISLIFKVQAKPGDKTYTTVRLITLGVREELFEQYVIPFQLMIESYKTLKW